jgi:hypothetical protein
MFELDGEVEVAFEFEVEASFISASPFEDGASGLTAAISWS